MHNRLLRSMPADVLGRLFPLVELVHLAEGEVLHEPGDTPTHAYFPTHAVLSLASLLENGDATAAAVIGNDGMVCPSLIMASPTSCNRASVYVAGHAYRLPIASLRAEFEQHREFAEVLLWYAGALMNQISHTVSCYRHHSGAAQLSRWLLLLLDRLPDRRIEMTHEAIAEMLGLRRESITEAALKLRKSGAIRYRRGVIEVLDRSCLEAGSCECYRADRRCDVAPPSYRERLGVAVTPGRDMKLPLSIRRPSLRQVDLCGAQV